MAALFAFLFRLGERGVPSLASDDSSVTLPSNKIKSHIRLCALVVSLIEESDGRPLHTPVACTATLYVCLSRSLPRGPGGSQFQFYVKDRRFDAGCGQEPGGKDISQL